MIAKDKTDKTAVKGMEFDRYSDSIYDCPVCPECETPLSGVKKSDIGKSVPCGYCGAQVLIPDEPWIRKYIEENTGVKEDTVVCIQCGGNIKTKMIKTNGTWRTFGGICEKCGAKYLV